MKKQESVEEMELAKYKKLAEEYKEQLDKVLCDYEKMNEETEHIKKMIDLSKKKTEEIELSYNCLDSEYASLQSEFLKIIELSQKSPKECMAVLEQYSEKIFQNKIVRYVSKGCKQTKFRIIEGGKKD